MIKNGFSSNNYSLSGIFNSYLDFYPLFIKGNKSFDNSNRKGPGSDGPINPDERGAFGNYLAIRDIIKGEDNDADINAMRGDNSNILVYAVLVHLKRD